MQPNDPYQTTPSGIDYLNQIAPPSQPQRQSFGKPKLILIVFGVIGLMIISSIVVLATNKKDTGPTPLKLVSRLQKLQSISDDYHRKIRSSAIQDINSSLRAVLTTANQAINTPLQSYEITVSKQKKEIAALDPADKLRTKLDDAYLNYRLESVYVREVGFQIEETLIMMKNLKKQTKFKSMREYLEKTIVDFDNLKKRFHEQSIATTERTILDTPIPQS